MAKINDNGVDRDMTAEELAVHKAWADVVAAEDAARAEAKEAAAAARLSALGKLSALGLTESEIAALVGQ
jgi:hypothetical protein